MNDSMMASQQNWDTSFFPAADSLKYNVAYQNMQTFDKIEDIPQLVRNAFDDMTGTSASCCIKYSGEVDETLAERALAVLNIIDNQLMSYSGNTYLGGYNWSYSEEDDTYFLLVSMYKYDDSLNSSNTNDALTEEEQEEFNTTIYDLFSDLFGDSSYSEGYDDYSDDETAVGVEITEGEDDSALDESYDTETTVVMDEEGE